MQDLTNYVDVIGSTSVHDKFRPVPVEPPVLSSLHVGSNDSLRYYKRCFGELTGRPSHGGYWSHQLTNLYASVELDVPMSQIEDLPSLTIFHGSNFDVAA